VRISRLPVGRLLAGGGLLLALAAFLLWLLPSPDYLVLPNPAQPLQGRVKVEGGQEPTTPGGIYYLDVTLRRATWLEHVFPFTRPDGASLTPGSEVVPHGSSFAAERKQNIAEMQRSETVAAAVALRQAGFHVRARNTGVLVESIFRNAPAAKSLHEGDVIVGVDGKATPSVTRLRHVLGPLRPHTVVTLRLRRAGTGAFTSVRVETIPDPSVRGRTIIGIYRAGQAADITLPVKVDIDLGDVGGPSAGLPFALDVFEQLGHDVDHGLKIAATGELDLDGSVGSIGGVKQKTFGARRAGVDVFLVPAGENAAEARRYAGQLRVVPVESFQQALRVLASLRDR
jgi:PDZ domain-containing protein